MSKRNSITRNPFRAPSVDDVLDSARDRLKAGDVKHGRPYGKGHASTPEILSTASHVLALAAKGTTGADYWRGSLTAAETARRVSHLFALAGGYTPSPSTCAARIGEHLSASAAPYAPPSPYFARGWSGNLLRAALSTVWAGRSPRVER